MSAEEEPDLKPVQIALNRLRLAAFVALEVGASRDQIAAEVAEAKRIYDRKKGAA